MPITRIIIFCFSLLMPTLAMAKNTCEAARVKLQMLGTGGPELLGDRASTGYLVWLDNKARVIIDAGPGSAQNFKRSGAKFEDVNVVLLTHFHVDHSADLSTYIKGGFFSQRKNDLMIFGPSGNKYNVSANQLVDRLFSAKQGAYPYLAPFIDESLPSRFKVKTQSIPWSYEELDVVEIYRQQDITIKSVSVHHGPFPAQAYRIEVAGCVLSFTGDMSGRLHAMPDLAEGSDILVAHNAIPEDAVGLPQVLHMKPSYIGELAVTTKVKKLLLTHMMGRSIYRQDDTLQEIKKHYQGSVAFPVDLEIFFP